MTSTLSTDLSSGVVEHGGLLYNKALKRCVDPGPAGARSACTLFAYSRISDETYRCVHRTAVPRWYAMRWLAGECIGLLERERLQRQDLRRRQRMCATVHSR